MKTKKSWSEKLLDNKGLPKVGKVTEKMNKRWGEGMMVIPAPFEVDEVMKKVPKGKLITINEIRQILAKEHNVNFCCPMTAGIFSWISANAADEQAREGKKKITPYWRTLKSGGEINPKFPGGVGALKALLKQEGHKVIQKGKRYFVKDYEKALIQL